MVRLRQKVRSRHRGGPAGRGRPQAARRAGLEFVEKVLTAMIRVVPSVTGLTRRLTGLVPCIRSVGQLPEGAEGTHRSGGVTR
jgi:hypothetical protein